MDTNATTETEETARGGTGRQRQPSGPTSDLLLGKEVYAVIGAAFEVHRVLGGGFLEAVYQRAMEIELSERAIPFEPQKRLSVQYKGRSLGKEYVADLGCFGQIIIELKAMERLSGTEMAQVLNYMKATGLKVGLLINFGRMGTLEWKRLVA